MNFRTYTLRSDLSSFRKDLFETLCFRWYVPHHSAVVQPLFRERIKQLICDTARGWKTKKIVSFYFVQDFVATVRTQFEYFFSNRTAKLDWPRLLRYPPPPPNTPHMDIKKGTRPLFSSDVLPKTQFSITNSREMVLISRLGTLEPRLDSGESPQRTHLLRKRQVFLSSHIPCERAEATTLICLPPSYESN